MILHSIRKGSGGPVLFLHTGLETSSTDFEYQQNYFASNFEVIAPDLRGHGKSHSNDFDDYFSKSAEDLRETLDEMQITNVHLVGCSLGAIVALFFVRQYPEYIKSLTLSGLMPVKPQNWNAMHEESINMQNVMLEKEEVREELDNKHHSDWQTLLSISRDSEWYPFEETEDLSDLNVPVLYIVGEGNHHEVTGASIYPKQNKMINVSVLPFAAHLVHDQQPEVYSQLLTQFINNVQNKSESTV
ncbi:alpha/beta fold hydrolase [Halobacillus sp. Nhm2S1]|uniref:alpha/beta fold hydrolase n=1 Tax=Halobacillus sp. Nhm2S1 TaxID=2866716 RepID=UPI001C73C73E|nr:alpha/beta hydrolase [Halobacillus sp. Nhm2S1]MBX0358456.1 alpha/beta hydrolase [Halobacillus sp. Nhm2S1]